ncbi:MAG: ATP-binding protein [Winogradskyella sp.]|uniref:ATP-binding protein n=1 Tax=Winogradskyella sp. TaxID=1883156 RepID=UPI0017993AE4|nr:ATP-binding protein [Winogradskyella sp.]MBT8244695.1 ATP-binding protein [Winogradskyella sp.]NNK23870.1 ATP-binding protein [Winogradskyella sp.]
MNPKKIAITGGPGTGKTSIIKGLQNKDYLCYEEISRQVTLQARKDGIEQLFLTEPLLFSQKLLEGRMQQFNNAKKEAADLVFLDRGIPDILAYMDFIGDIYPKHFIEACEVHKYESVFILPPWEDIFVSDAERYENFEQSKIINNHLLETYQQFGYNLKTVPFGTVEERVNFILENLHL